MVVALSEAVDNLILAYTTITLDSDFGTFPYTFRHHTASPAARGAIPVNGIRMSPLVTNFRSALSSNAKQRPAPSDHSASAITVDDDLGVGSDGRRHQQQQQQQRPNTGARQSQSPSPLRDSLDTDEYTASPASTSIRTPTPTAQPAPATPSPSQHPTVRVVAVGDQPSPLSTPSKMATMTLAPVQTHMQAHAAPHSHYAYPAHSVMEDSDNESDMDEHEAIAHEIAATQQYYADQGMQYGMQQPQQPHGAYQHGVQDDDGIGDDDDEDMYSDDGSSTASIPDENIDFSLIYALHTFLATVEGQASVVKGDSLLLLDDANSYWWLVRVLKTEDVGYIPAENVETPFERLARLNKHRNIEVALATLDDKSAAAAGGGRSASAMAAAPSEPAGKERRGLLGWRGRRDNEAARRVVFAPPTYVEHPGVTWSSDDEDDDDEGERGDEEGEAEDELAGEDADDDDELEPDDGVEWAEDAVEDRRAEHAAQNEQQQQGQQHQQQHQLLQHQQQHSAQQAGKPGHVDGDLSRGVAYDEGPDADEQPRHIPTTVVTPSTPTPSHDARAPLAPAIHPHQPELAAPPAAAARKPPRAMRYTDDFDFTLVLALARARALATRLSSVPHGGSLAVSTSLARSPSTSSTLSPPPAGGPGASTAGSGKAAPALPPPDIVQKTLYGARPEMDGVVHPEIRSCYATLCARLDAWDREVDELLGSVGVIGALVAGRAEVEAGVR